jgi:hypothetical protein
MTPQQAGQSMFALMTAAAAQKRASKAKQQRARQAAHLAAQQPQPSLPLQSSPAPNPTESDPRDTGWQPSTSTNAARDTDTGYSEASRQEWWCRPLKYAAVILGSLVFAALLIVFDRNGLLPIAIIVYLLAGFALLSYGAHRVSLQNNSRSASRMGARPLMSAHDDYIRGTVRAFQARNETTYESTYKGKIQWTQIVWTFRIERRDSHGNRLPPVPVEMRAYWFAGSLNDGDEIEVYGPNYREGTTIYATQLMNLTTRSTVLVSKARRRVWPRLLFVLVLVSVAVFVVSAWLLPR